MEQRWFCCEESYLTPRVLWKNSVLTAFYAVFTKVGPQNGTKNAPFRGCGPRGDVPKRWESARPPPAAATLLCSSRCHNVSGACLLSCAICEIRKEKRFCPAVHGRICPQCCGEQREVTLDCPSDCPYLQQAREHEKPRPLEALAELDLFRTVDISDQFLYEHEHLIVGLTFALAKSARCDRSINDADLIAALSTMARAQETLVNSGLHYEV